MADANITLSEENAVLKRQLRSLAVRGARAEHGRVPADIVCGGCFFVDTLTPPPVLFAFASVRSETAFSPAEYGVHVCTVLSLATFQQQIELTVYSTGQENRVFNAMFPGAVSGQQLLSFLSP